MVQEDDFVWNTAAVGRIIM